MEIERVEKPDVEVIDSRRTIVTALPLKRPARKRLAELLDARVEDIRAPIEHPDLVLTPACSPKLITGLKKKYNGARVVIVELDDWDFDIDLGGPVKRLLGAGADAYVLADSLEELAGKIAGSPPSREADESVTEIAELTVGSTVDELIEAFLGQSVEYSTRLNTERPNADA